MPLDGGTMEADSTVWLHRLELEDALQNGAERVAGKSGCRDPGATTTPSAPPGSR